MDNKCEWEDGMFEGCINLRECCQNGIILGSNTQTEWKGDYELFITANCRHRYITFCPFCGADIRKPGPKAPLIEERYKRIHESYIELSNEMAKPWEPLKKAYTDIAKKMTAFIDEIQSADIPPEG